MLQRSAWGCNTLSRKSARHLQCKGRRSIAVQALLKTAPGVEATWSQTTDDVLVRVPAPTGTRGKSLRFEVHPTRLKLWTVGNSGSSSSSSGGQVLLEGSLSDAGDINVDECFWELEDGVIVVTLSKKTMGHESWQELLESDKVDLNFTERVFLRVEAGGQVLGNVVLGLFGAVCPKTVANFVALCDGTKQGSSGKPLSFVGSSFHRVIPGFMAQGGDITRGDGTGGDSIYGPEFPDENFKAKHEGPGYLAMANAGPNTNNSQFYITYSATPHLNGKHVVFGRVVSGMEIMRRVEALGTQSGATKQPVKIAAAGLVADDEHALQLRDENTRLKSARVAV